MFSRIFSATCFLSMIPGLFLVSCLHREERSSTAHASTETCQYGPAVETDGHRRLALIIGVGEYKNPRVNDLTGPPNDAQRVYDLLVDPNGYNFPEENVCMLLNEEATTDRVKEAFQKVLVERAQENRDVAVLFYAGHGSRAPDRNGDEPDEWDETFMFHDARTGSVGDFLDDEFNGLLEQLYRKTTNITVILDSCNSGSATRAANANTFRVRFEPPAEDHRTGETDPAAGADGAASWVPEEMPGLILFSAAADGTSALETVDPVTGRSGGIFTDALLEVLARVENSPLTYAQAARSIPPLVAARSYQVPFFHGILGGAVFGNEGRTRPLAWEVRSVGPPIELAGPAMPGIGRGAEVRIYDGRTQGAATRDPSRAKATAVVEETSGLNALVTIVAAPPGAPEVSLGDLAILIRPADDYVRIRVRVRPSSESGGVPATRSAAIRDAVARNPEAAMLVDLTDGAGDFELSLAHDQRLQLRGPENRVRNTYPLSREAAEVARSLWKHARQKALLQLKGEGGEDMVENETLQVQLIPAPRQTDCARGEWVQANANQEQVIPLCHRWNIRVTSKASMPLLVGALILSSEGTVLALPADGRQELLRPGETVIFNHERETFEAFLPLDVWDQVMVFGTQQTNPVPWHLIADTSAVRSASGIRKTGLYGALDRYLIPGTRGTRLPDGDVEDTTWTMSTVPTRVLANSRFCSQYPDDQTVPGCPSPTTAEQVRPQRREYTISKFDIRPYLPDNRESALFKVLQKADFLAHHGGEDGVGYQQHDWSQPTDEANLSVGIDCSRAVWFVFTRSGLPYNRDDRYLHSGLMVGSDSLMGDKFEGCGDDGAVQIGDVLVYRDPGRGVGHTVIVIDPEKRVAWGSHGWDGSVREGLETDSGVEYQLIKYKQDWERWDRPEMRRVACWRYQTFALESDQPGGRPGVAALASACDAGRGCGNR